MPGRQAKVISPVQLDALSIHAQASIACCDIPCTRLVSGGIASSLK